MSDDIPISKTLSIRACGKDAFWLQDQIAADSNIPGFGGRSMPERQSWKAVKQQSLAPGIKPEAGGRLRHNPRIEHET